MAQLSRLAAERHNAALALLDKPNLTYEERWQILEHFQEGATHLNGLAGAFFTPPGLAGDFSIEVPRAKRLIDLCAGIGTLAYMQSPGYQTHTREPLPEIVCIDANPDYVAVGKKLIPEATWITANVFDLPDLGHFDVAISNPPFGKTPRDGKAPRYTGPAFEYHVIDIASDIADFGVFIIPQASAPFIYSGSRNFRHTTPAAYQQFQQQTGITLTHNCGIDTAFYRGEWHGVGPTVEIVNANFMEARKARAPTQPASFDFAA